MGGIPMLSKPVLVSMSFLRSCDMNLNMSMNVNMNMHMNIETNMNMDMNMNKHMNITINMNKKYVDIVYQIALLRITWYQNKL